ncbi:unnamed protein product [Durusdinium trenchii]|uniref:Nitronate monooxygenase domain-containing protein n=2 Tax=Durusdinium trenchii TaxID=1381693 RepID=A0ABP0K3Y4_9DINO
MPLRTALTEMLGIEHPIIQGGMQYVGYAEMASAVSNAGGLGILTALTQPSPEALRADAWRTTILTPESLRRKRYTPMWKAAGVKVLHKSATMRHALKAQEAGVDIIEIVGYEGSIAGGQPGDEVGAWVLLAKATSTLRVPVVAAGASGTGRQLAAALAMGAQGVTMATRFLCTVEAPIDMKIKECMARPEVDERQTTIVLGTLSNATRVFKNGVAEEIRQIERQGDVDFSQVMPLASGGRTKKMWQETGDTQDAMWSCSQSLGVISDIPTCKELLRRMVAEAEERLNHGAKCIINSKL